MKNYHPIEFKKSRPFFEHLVRTQSSFGVDDIKTSSELIKFMEKAQMIHRSRRDEYMVKVHNEYQACVSLIPWAHEGRAIYDFPPLLLDEFANTNLDEINTSDIQLPFQGFYMHFENSGIYFGRDLIIGAYVFSRPDGAVEFRAVGTIGEVGQPNYHHEPIIYEKNQEQTIEALVEQHFLEGLTWWSRHADFSDDPHGAQLLSRERQKEFLTSYDFTAKDIDDIEGMSNAAKSMELEKILTPALEKQIKMRKRFVSLVFNCLLYMSAFPDDKELGFAEEGISPILAKSYFGGKGKEFIKAKAQVLKSGYTPVVTIGTQFEHELSQAGYQVGTSSVSAHWRRGHWRRIKDKDNLELKRLVRVKACRVGFSKDDDGLEHSGHIYQIEKKEP